MPPIVSIVGRSGSGKTTLIEKLIPEIKRRGYRVGTIKHTHHPFEVDQPGKDSSRHRAAGADTVMLAAPGKVAMIKDVLSDRLDALVDYFRDVDLLITEGFKRESRPKIEVIRAAMSTEMLCRDDPQLIAVATDTNLKLPLPVFALNDPEPIVDFIEQHFLLARK
jgi:molybdopterin-guanine dinucleotide biosynthesis adapter protein